MYWCSTAALAVMLLGAARPQGLTPDHPFRISLSISPFTDSQFETGIVFKSGEVTARNLTELQQLFISNGANEVYARIATRQERSSAGGDHSMARAMQLATIARSLSIPFNPELGLFHMYGDVRCQPPPDFHDYPQIKIPKAWHYLTLEEIIPMLRAYGAAVARQILSTGVRVRIWDIGNEVEFGMAGVAVRPLPGGCDNTESEPGWYQPPDAVDPAIGRTSVAELMGSAEARRITWLETHLWPHEARMIAAVADGVRLIDPQARFSTHVSGITSVIPAQAVAFYKAMNGGGFQPDELGVSYYPSSSATPKDRLQAFKDTATALHQALGRPVFISEFGYPAAKMQGVFNWNYPLAGYPLSPRGQADFIRDLVAWGVHSRVLSGIRPWAPDLAGAGWGPVSMFERNGKVAEARPSLSAAREAVSIQR